LCTCNQSPGNRQDDEGCQTGEAVEGVRCVGKERREAKGGQERSHWHGQDGGQEDEGRQPQREKACEGNWEAGFRQTQVVSQKALEQRINKGAFYADPENCTSRFQIPAFNKTGNITVRYLDRYGSL